VKKTPKKLACLKKNVYLCIMELILQTLANKILNYFKNSSNGSVKYWFKVGMYLNTFAVSRGIYLD